jgi:alkanesulfonate monooxygenase SsuD/methylene tetrahydromethanopterin reductase-like flavin-dependent oxidoreductase (luciferase family)
MRRDATRRPGASQLFFDAGWCPGERQGVAKGEQGSLDKFQQWGSKKTLRELIHDSAEFASSIELLGTPDGVAERMGEIIEEVGGDGFLITSNNQSVSRRYVLEVTGGLVPALQRRGLVRSEYACPMLRDNLRAF